MLTIIIFLILIFYIDSEENVWHLCRLVKEKHKANLSECFCVFISNLKRSIPLWHQKAGQANRQGLVVWVFNKFIYYISILFYTIYTNKEYPKLLFIYLGLPCDIYPEN